MKKMEPGICLDLVCGGGENSCDGQSCVRIQSFQKVELATWFGDITEKEKSEVQIVAECYASTTVNIATALGFFSRMCSLQSLELLESEHQFVTALSVESWPGVLQMIQKHIILPMVSSDVDVLVVHGDEASHEEASEGVSTVPGQERAGSFQEILANPSQCDNHGLEKSW